MQVLKHGLNTIPVDRVNSVLLLGLGGGSIVKSLRNKYGYNGPVVGVEIDPVVIEIARQEFDIHQDKHLEIVCMDAMDYIEQSNRLFDLIIVDLFIDLYVPEKFYHPRFWVMLEKNVTLNGFVLFNAGIDLDEKKVKTFVQQLPPHFVYQKNYNVLEANTVIILHKIA